MMMEDWLLIGAALLFFVICIGLIGFFDALSRSES